MHDIQAVTYIYPHRLIPTRSWDRSGYSTLLIAIVMILVTTACAVNENTKASDTQPNANTSETYQEIVNNRSVQVGVRCQQDYQNGWLADVGNNDIWNRCGNFVNNISPYERLGFYYNLHGGKPALEQPDTCGWACGYADSVDFFYMNTHGGSDTTSSYWGMWDQNSLAFSSSMRLGASGRENMIFATFSCDTHVTDNFTWARWIRPFSGGLVTTVGGHSLLYNGNTQSASEFVSRLINNGESIKNAWLESTWYADNANSPGQINTGANSNDCFARSNTTLDTLFGTPILRDSAIGYMCWVWWNQ